MLSFQGLTVSLSIILGLILGILGLISGFKYAKDIFTPTRKSVLLSGIYLLGASLSCTFPTIIVVSDTINLFGIIVVLFQTGFDKHSSCDKLKAKMP
jgi:hypothetical protein